MEDDFSWKATFNGRFDGRQTLTLFPTGGCFSPPQTDIANYGVFCIENMLFYYLTFHITGLPNFWRKKNLKLFGGTPNPAPPMGPLKISNIQNFQN